MRIESGRTVGRYEILDELGHGGMSESYRARDRETGETVVLKMPFPHVVGDLSAWSRYQREMEIGRRLDHPNIQRLLDTGNLPGSNAPYIVMEYVEGEPLRTYLQRCAPLSVEEAVDLAQQLAGALEACHRQGIVHRDLKPENVLIRADHQLKLLDFGIALLQGARRLTWSRLTPTVGTPDYMAPEQVRGERGDARTDVYALGTMLFEMLAGKVPYEGDNALSIMNQHVTRETPRLSTVKRDIPLQIEAIVAKATRRDPSERYASMAELLADLLNWRAIDPEDSRFEWEDTDTLTGVSRLATWWEEEFGGELPSPGKTALIVVGVLMSLALLGVLAEVLHGAH